MTYRKDFPSPIGILTAVSDGTSITGLWMENQRYWGQSVSADPADGSNLEVMNQLQKWLDAYFNGKEPSFFVPCKADGTVFQQAVWEQLNRIPYGKTVTYGQIAKTIEQESGKIVSAQAVGNAIGRNPICILIPCHRVIGSNGELTGYAAGIDRKRILLELEKAI